MKSIDTKNNLAPNFFAESVEEIKFEDLNTKLILFDLDATLVEHGSMKINDKIIKLIKTLKTPVGIATNRMAPKGDELAKLLGAKYVFHATKSYRKPSKKYFDKIIEKSTLKPSEITMIGDRLFSDIYGANRAGLKTIMVRNIGDDPWYIKYFQIRNLEYLILKLISKIK